MTAAVAVHQCLFCSRVFNNASAKDEHILEHFAQEVCSDCDQDLIRIGSRLYTLHETATCIKRERTTKKKLPNSIELCTDTKLPCENRYGVINEVNTNVSSVFEEILIKVEPEDEPVQQEQAEFIVLETEQLSAENIIEVDDEHVEISQEEVLVDVVVETSTEPIVVEECEIQANSPSLCDICGRAFDSEQFLESHRKLKHGQAPIDEDLIIPEIPLEISQIEEIVSTEEICCDFCDELFDSKLSLESHKKLKHAPKVSRKRPKTSLTKPIRNEAPKVQSNSCDICGQPFDCQLFLESHKKLKHPAEVKQSKKLDKPHPVNKKQTAGKSNKKGSKLLKKDDRPEKKFECIICYKMYATELSLRTHVETIHDPSARKFPCKICKQAFFRECALQYHMKQVHLNAKSHKCDTCGVRLKSKAALARHVYQHTGNRPIACLWKGCKKTFSCSSNRDEHLRSHTGEKPFQCTINGCDSRFAFATDFRRHKFYAHNVCSKVFQCEICSVCFPENGLLRKHMVQKHNKR